MKKKKQEIGSESPFAQIDSTETGMYELICGKRFDKIDHKLDNDIPHWFMRTMWIVIGSFLGTGGLLFVFMKLILQVLD